MLDKDGVLAKHGAASIDELVKRAAVLADGDPPNGVGENPDAAMQIYNDVMLVAPDHAGCLYGVGIVLREAGRYAQGTQIAKRITAICPRDPRGWKLLATIYGEMSQYDESIKYADKALMCAVNDYTLADAAYAHCNAGNWKEADAYSKRALEMAKASPTPLAREATTNAEVTQAYCRLAFGDWEAGFLGYRKTLRTKWRKEREYPSANGGRTTEWQGEPDAVVIITTEQGLGDEVMAASVIMDAAKSCKRIILDCDHRLAPLFERSFPGVFVTPQRRVEQMVLPREVGLPTHHKSLFGLSELFRKTDADFHRTPFLVPNQEYVGMFRELFGGQRTIGLAWSGGLPRTAQEQRTVGLSAFLPLVRRGEAEFVSLQYKDDAAEVAAFERAHGVKIRRLPWATQSTDMDLLTGLVAACDEVVGVHTTVMHLASSVGVPTTILTHRGSGWRYNPPELLWYPPTTGLWRKKVGESWRDCVNRLVENRKLRLAA